MAGEWLAVANKWGHGLGGLVNMFAQWFSGYDDGDAASAWAPRTSDGGPAWTSVFGVSGARYTSADRSASAASVTDAPTSTKKLVITDVLISVDTAMRVDLKEETSGTVLASIYLPANGAIQFTPRSKFKLATADKKLQVQTSAAGNIAVTAYYYSEA